MNISKSKRIALIAVCVLIACISFFGIAKAAASPDMHKQTILSLDEKQKNVTEMAAVSAATATALAAVPGDATTPVANKLVDLSGYLVVVMALILLEKYLVTLTGLLAFKILIPIACGLFIAFLLSDYDWLRQIGVRLLLFGIILVVLIPASVGASNVIEETYEKSVGYSLEQAQQDQKSIESKSEDKSFWTGLAYKTSAKIETVMNKGKRVLSNFIEFIAVMLVVNLAIPILILMLFIWLVKLFLGININVKKTAKLPHEMMKIKHKKSDKISEEV